MNSLLFLHLFLLVAFSVTTAVNAAVLRERSTPTNFGLTCQVNGTDVESIHVIVNPNPVVSGKNATFSVSGRLNNDIANNGLVLIGFEDDIGFFIGGGSAPAPPTKAGNDFSVDATLKVPNDLPNTYAMKVSVVNPSNPPDPKDIIGCIGAVIIPDGGPDGSLNKIAVSKTLLSLAN